MHFHLQIEYHRPAKDDKERQMDGDWIPIESFVGIAVDNTETLNEFIEEFKEALKLDPCATLTLGGICNCHKE